MKIRIKYFAGLKELAQKPQESLEFEGKTAEQLWQVLVDRYGFIMDGGQLRVAINDEYVPLDTEIQENDLVVFIPPVAGG